ncbi:unnamed protein product, partial [Amoebophrya sp. A120]|eukprot:GSA120T00023423001.1
MVDLRLCGQDADIVASIATLLCNFAKLLTEEVDCFQLFFNEQEVIAKLPVFTQSIALIHCPTAQINTKAKHACLYVLNLLQELDVKTSEELLMGSTTAASVTVTSKPLLSPTMSSWFRAHCCALFIDTCVLLREQLFACWQSCSNASTWIS